jgi:hypothetical protein
MMAGEVPLDARIKPSLRQAWTNIWPNFWWLLLFGFLALLPGSGPTNTDLAHVRPVDVAIDVGGGLIGIFVGIPLGFGVTKAHLAASRGEKPTWSDLGYAFGPRYWPSIGLGLLTMLIIVGGLVLLIIPGIYWAVRLAFTHQRFVADGLGVRDSIRASFADTGGRWWSVFGLAMMSLLLVIAGVLALIVGVFVALVLIHQMWVIYWRSIQAQRGPYVPIAK